MEGTKREYTLGIWALALGYFLSYIPYSGLSKAVTSGLLSDGHPIPGAEVLPSATMSTAATILFFVTVMGWWRYGRKRQRFGLNLPYPRRQTITSGIGFAVVIITTTLAYSFSGVSIILALVLMRAGVLIMSPIIDRVFQRRVRWFSWAGLILSLTALAVAFSDIHGYRLSFAALLNLAAYLTGHALRIPSMTQIAKTGEKEVALSYFVEEQAVAMPLIVLVPAALAVVGQGEVANQLRLGFTHIFSAAFSPFGWVIGLFYAALGIFLSFIYLDRRENTFCMPLFSCSSLLSGIVASYGLMWWAHGPAPSRIQTSSAFLLTTALLVMSPLHHLPLYIRQLKDAIVERRLVLLTIVKDDSESIPDVAGARTLNFITINLDAVRDIWRKVAPTR
jgi:hypothetical protein